MRIGLFGGTFDPIHRGHVDVARAAREALSLDCVWLVPSRLPPHRGAPSASAAHRFAMVALALAGERALMVSDIEMNTAGPSYTAETLDRLEAVMDLSGLFLVTGADAFRDIASWRGYPSILDRCHFIVVSRPGCGVESLPDALPDLAGRMAVARAARLSRGRPTIYLVDAQTSPVSSTDVRRAIDAGRPLEDLVAPTVAEYIRRQGLYLAAPPMPNVAKEPA